MQGGCREWAGIGSLLRKGSGRDLAREGKASPFSKYIKKFLTIFFQQKKSEMQFQCSISNLRIQSSSVIDGSDLSACMQYCVLHNRKLQFYGTV